MLSVIAKVRASRLRRRITPLEAFYGQSLSIEEVRDWQLGRLNSLWHDISKLSPYYARLRETEKVPAEFSSWEEFSSTMPSLGRADLSRSIATMRLHAGHVDYWRTTGGSTAEPIQIPAMRDEDTHTGALGWYARSWFGVEPSDRLFLVWGHSHLLGTGIRGWIGARKRALKDACLGYIRHSAYDMSDESLREAARLILRHRPAYIVGYSVALHRLAHANRALSTSLRSLGLKVIIATGESFPFPDSAALVAEVFGAPVAMEYGAVETGIIAHQEPDGAFKVFWGACHVEGIESRTRPGSYEILVTTLYPRLIPLLRYRLGDLVASDSSEASLEQRFSRVIGRCNDVITVGTGASVHSEAFSHVLRDIGQIEAFQVVQQEDLGIRIEYVSDAPLPADIIVRVREKLHRVDAGLSTTVFRQVPRLQTSIAGKSKRIMSAGDSSA